MGAGRKVFVIAQMFGTERFGDFMFLAEPLAKIDELAAVRTERAVFPREPFVRLFAGRAFADFAPGHRSIVNSAV